jgi:glycosyltransferase involved in cell wall biosynthesis
MNQPGMNQARASAAGRVTLVLGTVAGGTGTHVRMLAEGLAGHAITVSVAGPASAGSRFSFSALPSVSFRAVEIGDRPRAGDLRVINQLRRLLVRSRGGLRPGRGRAGPSGAGPGGAARSPGLGAGDRPGLVSPGVDGPSGEGHVAHAHGMRAGALTVLALLGARRRPAVVVTVHNAPPAGGGAAGIIYRLLERVVALGADAVLCVSPDLEARMRAAGARRVGPAVIAAPVVPAAAGPAAAVAKPAAPSGAPGREPGAVTVSGAAQGTGAGLTAAGEIAAAGRPVVLAIGRLAAQKGFAALLDAAPAWRDLDPPPQVVVAGDGPLKKELSARAAALGVDAALPGHVGDVPALLATAAVFVMPSQWEGQPLVLQEALRAGVPVVATRVGGVPGLTGDGALLVPPGDTAALAAAVRAVLTDPAVAVRLRAAAADRATDLPTPADAVDNALTCYNTVVRTT